MGSTANILRKLVPVLISFAVLAACIVILRADIPLNARLRNVVFDTYQQIDPRTPFEGSPVLIVDIDDVSLQKIGQWPWPRDYLAAITGYLQDIGAAAIVYDVFFAEPDGSSPSTVFGRLPEEARSLLDGITLPNNDLTFASTIARGRVVLGMSINDGSLDDGRPPPDLHYGITTSEPSAMRYLPAAPGLTRNIGPLEESAAGLGMITISPDVDGVIRKVPIMYRVGDQGYASLALEALRVAQGENTYSFKTVGGSGEQGFGENTGIVKMKVGQFIIPTDHKGAMRIHFAHAGAEEVVPIWKIVTGDVDPAVLQGRIVLIGTSAIGLRDLRFNTLGEEVPGVFMHAQMIDQILTESYLVRPDWAEGAEFILTIVVSFLLIVVVMRFGAVWSAILGGVLVLAGAGGALWAFLEMRLLFDPLLPSVAALAVFMVCSSARYWQTEREQKFIRGAFKTFVSPNLVDSLALHPEALKLGGTRKECTFIFTDLAGFTSFVEKSDPEVAVPLLNDYIDNMVRIGLKHGGYLDKIVGDATVFHFNAFLPPLDQPDHRQRAYDCAMEMYAWSDAYSKQKQAEGIPLNETRIGINSGMVTMGNFGGAVMDYTAHGDAINTAARLESAGKFLGVHVSLAGATLEGVSNFVGRPCGTLVLKGQTSGTPVFEPMTPDRLNGPAVQKYLEAYELMKAEDPNAEEAMEEVLLLDPDDGLAKMHLRRLRDGQNGIRIVMTSK